MIETNLGSMLGDNMWTQEVSEGKTYEDNVKDSVMDALQQMYILEDHMAEYEVALTDEEKSAIQEAAKNSMRAMSWKPKNWYPERRSMWKEC